MTTQPGNHLDIKMAQAKLYAAIQEVSGAQQQAFVLRPSNIGQCPLRLQFSYQDPDSAGAAREPRAHWSVLQGVVNEELMRQMLGIAGAEILAPPEDSDKWMEGVEPDAETGFKPHLDGLIRWPEVGMHGWHVLELKYLRASAQLKHFEKMLYGDRTYWFQAVSYLMTSQKAIENYAAFEEATRYENGEEWTKIYRDRIVPAGLFFFSAAKDPAQTRAMMSGKTKVPQYETTPPKKGYTDQQKAMMAMRHVLRQTMEEYDNNSDFYFEVVAREDQSVGDAWLDIINTKIMVEQSERAEPLHNINVSDDELDEECRWYCPYLEKHRMMGFTVMAEQLQEEQEESMAMEDISGS